MTELETQLLSIIEEQQQQLQTALNKLEAQTKTISELENYAQTLTEYSEKLESRNTELGTLIKKLQTPHLSEELLSSLQTNFKQRLESHLEKLITDIELKKQITVWLPSMVQEEIKVQIKPLASEFLDEKDKITVYHNNLSDLIQKLSLKL